MSDDSTTKETSKKKLDFVDILKLITAFGVIIPLLLGYFEYRRSVQQDIDKNFRDLVEKLSSEKKENRLAGATNLGTFIWKREEYYNEAIDILINAIALERDINVLNAIRGSLEKVEPEDYRKILQKILNIERNAFIYEYPLRKLNLEEELNQLTIQSALVTNFIAIFLSLTRNNTIDSLKFYQNSLNELALTDLKFSKSTIENSALSLSIIINTDFDNSKIINSVFTFSSFDNCNFSGCEISGSLFDHIKLFKDVDFKGSTFNDVFFFGSNLNGADFTGVKGLKPIYFYKADNIDKAVFDKEFREELKNMEGINETEFIEYLYNSRLTEQRIGDLLNLKEINPDDTVKIIEELNKY